MTAATHLRALTAALKTRLSGSSIIQKGKQPDNHKGSYRKPHGSVKHYVGYFVITWSLFSSISHGCYG